MTERRSVVVQAPEGATRVHPPGARLAGLQRNAWRPVLVGNEAPRTRRIFRPHPVDTLAERGGDAPRLNTLARQSLLVNAMRSLHQIDVELVGDVADDQV